MHLKNVKHQNRLSNYGFILFYITLEKIKERYGKKVIKRSYIYFSQYTIISLNIGLSGI